MKNKILIGLVIILCIETLWLAVVNRNLKKELAKFKFILYTPYQGCMSQDEDFKNFFYFNIISLPEPNN